jgi:hypothetical protein
MQVTIHTDEGLNHLHERLSNLKPDTTPHSGEMNCSEMVCHISDIFRLANGEIMGHQYRGTAPEVIDAMANAGKTVENAEAMTSAKGTGTMPTHFEADLNTFKELLAEFNGLPEDHPFAPHPYFGQMSKQDWTDLANYHINHHLELFGV